MAKGAYLVTERKRIFRELGEEVYTRLTKGEITISGVEGKVKELDRLTKKVELEEMLIRNLRFGEVRSRKP